MLLSVVAAAPSGCDLRPFFGALERGGFLAAPDVEVIFVGMEPCDQTPAGVLYRLADANSSIFSLWGEGILRTQAPVIALLDVRCPPAPGWLDAVRARLPLAAPAMFGPVQYACRVEAPDIVGYLVEYAQFAPPLPSNLAETPGLNLILMRKAALDPRTLRQDGFVKTRLLAALKADGDAAPVANNDAVVCYEKRYRFKAYCMHRFRHARCYAADRPMPLGALSRMIAVLSTPALPALRTWRIFQNARRSPFLLRASVTYLHRIVAAETAWALGELAGYLTGAGRAGRPLT